MQRTKKILIDARLLVRDRVSGIEEYTKQLIDHILLLDEENHYEFFYNGFRKVPFPQEWLKKKNTALLDWRIPNKLLDFSLKFFHFPTTSQISDAEIVFSPHFNLLWTDAGVKRIITFHDLSFLHYPEFYPPRKHFWHWQQSYLTQAANAQKIIAVSEFTRHDLITTLHLYPQKIEVIYSGIDPFYCKLSNETDFAIFRKKYNLHYPFLLFVGVIEPRKNIPGLITAFELLKKEKDNRQLKLIIVGEKGWLYKKIFERAHNSVFSKDIIFWGRANKIDLRYLYNLASVFVYPSFFEGFGFPPLEAQACGTAVVASNRSSLPEILDSSAILVDPNNIYELTQAIKFLLESEELRERYIKLGQENIKRFNWLETAKKIIKLFNE
jgi:glycosyltransferase involved in cell wall biosynthesis